MYYGFYRLSFIVCVVIAISSCGGGGDNSSGNSRIAALQISSANNQVLTIDNDNKVVTYTVAINNFPTGSTGYNVSIAKKHANTEINIINNKCTGRLVTGSCTFDVQYNPSAENIRGRPNYGKTDNTITVTAAPASGGGALKQIFNVQTSNDPLNTTTNKYIGDYSADADARGVSGLLNVNFAPIDWIYSTNNISNLKAGSWTSSNGRSYAYPFNVPLIQTYSPTIGIFSPALALRTRCDNTLIYLVVQSKLTEALTLNLPRNPPDPSQEEVEQAGRENVTVKFHPLIADGLTNGIKDHPHVLNGRLTIKENGHPDLIRNTQVNAHDSIWSGAEDIPRLRELITTHTANANNTIISILDNISGAPFIDPQNVGVNKIITIHSLLTPDAYDDLREQYLRHHHNLGDIAKLADDRTLTLYYLDDTFRNSLKAYRAEVAEACSA